MGDVRNSSVEVSLAEFDPVLGVDAIEEDRDALQRHGSLVGTYGVVLWLSVYAAFLSKWHDIIWRNVRNGLLQEIEIVHYAVIVVASDAIFVVGGNITIWISFALLLYSITDSDLFKK